MIGSQIRALRKENRMTQQELASKLYVSQQAVGKWERGEATPNPDAIVSMAKIFGVSADRRLGESAPPASTGGAWIPVIGDVAAGIPIEAITDIVDYEEIDAATAASGDFFARRIKGSSMEPRIREGDVVIVRKQDDAETGDTAVVLVNGDSATVKKIKKMPDGIQLIPTNPAYDPMYYTAAEVETLPVRIIGRVVELRGKF